MLLSQGKILWKSPLKIAYVHASWVHWFVVSSTNWITQSLFIGFGPKIHPWLLLLKRYNASVMFLSWFRSNFKERFVKPIFTGDNCHSAPKKHWPNQHLSWLQLQLFNQYIVPLLLIFWFVPNTRLLQKDIWEKCSQLAFVWRYTMM